MANPFSLVTPSTPNSVLGQQLWQKLVYPPLMMPPDRTVREVLSLLKGVRIVCDASLDIQVRSSCVSIVENGQPIGILTERALFRLCTERQDLDNLAIRDVMSTDIVTLNAADFTDLAVAIDLLDLHHLHHLLVVDDRHCLVGIVTRESLQEHLAEALNAKIVQLEVENIQLLAHSTIDRCEEQMIQLQEREAQLQESQHFLQTVIEIFPLALFWKDRESRYLGCNYNFAQDAKLNTPLEIVGKNDYDFSWGEIEGDDYRADDHLTITSGTSKLGIIETQTLADGSSRWIETNKIPLRNCHGETIGVLGTYQDITERRQAEAQLSKLSERLSLSLKSGSVGCWEWDIIQDLLIWDDRMYELYGGKRSPSDPEISEAYATWIETIHPDDRLVTEDLLAKAILGQAEFDTEFRVIHPDQSIHFIKAYGLVQRDEQDRPLSMTGINFDITATKHDEIVRQQNEQMMLQQAERESVLREITQRIRKSLDLKTIFETSVQEIRQFMETDRVGIFKLNSDPKFDGGEFVAESVGNGFKSVLGIQIHNPGFGKRLELLYRQGKINQIPDIYQAGLPDDQIQFLARCQVRANLLVPLVNGASLWGYLSVDHCSTARSWQESEINFVTQIAEQIGIGIQQATLYEKVQLELKIRWRAEEAIAFQLRQQQTLGAIAQQIRNSLQVEEILRMATIQIKELMIVDRVNIFRVFPDGKSRVIQEVVSPEYPALVDLNWEDEQFSKEGFEFYLQGKPRIVADVMQDDWSRCLNECMSMAQVKSKIVAPILLPFATTNTHRWVNTKGDAQLWGLLIVHSCGTQRHWQDAEAQLLQQVADQLAIAIQQASLFEQLQQELTERQQAKEAIALQLKQQRTLGALSQQIRNSLNVAEILATATEQVKELMMVDRASIFQVSPKGHLQAVEEVVSPGYARVTDRNWDNEYLSNEEFEFYLEGNPNVVFDLKQDPRSASLQEYVDHIGAKSKIVVPILLLFGDSQTEREIETWNEPHLWGLLSVHSCSTHRHWQDSEVKLVQQIADQLALAIHQASLFEKLQQELTERQQAETRLLGSNQQLAVSNQELARATRLKDEFLASMSHELRTPLNAILGLSESLQDGVFGAINEPQQKSIITIEKSGKHLLALINDILDLSKIEANKFNLELTDVSIQSLCQNSLLFIKELAHKRQIRLHTQLPEPLKYLNIRVDDLRFRQVLINLLSNAVKFTPEGGSITLDVRVVEGQISFSITDTGIGISPENMGKLFQSFVQIDSSLSRQYAGTGLGLALAKRIVEMHGGTVSVQSEVNRGSCFTICLPVDLSAEMAAISSGSLGDPMVIDAPAEETPQVKPQTSILLVEDNEANIETMMTYLQSRGYRIVVAENGLKAISILEDYTKDLARAQHPDIILMDIQMPGIDGFEATRRIRQLPEYTDIPIIALTALAMPTDCQKCLDAGANRYVAKPVKLSQLVATIESLLNSR